MSRPLVRTALTLLAFASLVPAVFAQEQKGGEMPPMGRPAPMDQIAFMQGDWNVTMAFRMGPDQPWQETTGASHVDTILDGCVQRMDFRSEIMGMPFHGIDHTSYNRERQRFESIWIDDMSAKFSQMSGNFVDGKLVMAGTDIMMGTEVQVRSTSEQVSDDEVRWNMEQSTDGENWFTSMKMSYERKP